jgi:hypothetical protein
MDTDTDVDKDMDTDVDKDMDTDVDKDMDTDVDKDMDTDVDKNRDKARCVIMSWLSHHQANLEISVRSQFHYGVSVKSHHDLKSIPDPYQRGGGGLVPYSGTAPKPNAIGWSNARDIFDVTLHYHHAAIYCTQWWASYFHKVTELLFFRYY